MKRVLLFLAFFFSTIFVIGSFASETSACSCAEILSAEESFNRSDAVFTGKVIEVAEEQSHRSVLFEVTETWKGINDSETRIVTGLDSAGCGFDFKVGQSYLVYAHQSEIYGSDGLTTTICDRTNELRLLQDDLIALGEGQSPTEQNDVSANQMGHSIYLWIIVIVFLVMLVGFWRKWRDK